MKNNKSITIEVSEKENTVINANIQDIRGLKTIREKLEMRNKLVKVYKDELVKSALKKTEDRLINGDLEAAANELKSAVKTTGDIRVLLPLTLMQYYELGGEKYDFDLFLHHLRLAASDGHIPSMHMLAMLYNDEHVADVYNEGQILFNRASILDPESKFGNYLNAVFSLKIKGHAEQVANIVKAIHEPASHFYNNEKVGKSAVFLDLPTSSYKRFNEIEGGPQCKELLCESVQHLHSGNYNEVERILKQVEKHDVAAANKYLATLYIGLGKKKKAFECVRYSSIHGCVPLMYTLSAMYRCSYGVKKSNPKADAWYRKAIDSDIDNRGLKTALIL